MRVYNGYPNFIKDRISHAVLLILVHVLTSCLTAIKNHVIEYCKTVYDRNGKNPFFGLLKCR